MPDPIDICPVPGCNDEMARVLEGPDMERAIGRCRDAGTRCFMRRLIEKIGAEEFGALFDRFERGDASVEDMLATLAKREGVAGHA